MWQLIASASYNGRTVEVCQMRDGVPHHPTPAEYREVTFPQHFDRGFYLPPRTVSGWMIPGEDKRAACPTHFREISQ